MTPKKNSEQEEAFEGQRIEMAQENAPVDASGGHPGKCPACGRDKANS